MSHSLACEPGLADNLFVLELEKRLEMVPAVSGDTESVGLSCCLAGSAGA